MTEPQPILNTSVKIRVKLKKPLIRILNISTPGGEQSHISKIETKIESVPEPEPEPEPVPEQKLTKNQETKTKKRKQMLSNAEKSKMWETFDSDKTSAHPDIECLYQQSILNSESNLCHQCHSVLIIMDDGYPTCTNNTCGIIYRDTLDYSPEWRFYGADDKNSADPTRCGNPANPLLLESSSGCKIICGPNASYEMKRISKWVAWQAMPHKEKSLYDEFQFITTMAQNSGIPKIFIDSAMIIHKDLSEQKMFRGVNRDGMKSASIYIACRLNGCPRTAHEIAEIFKLDKTSATNGCSMAVNILHNIERNKEPDQQTVLETTTPSSFIERYCSRLNFTHELTMLAKFIAKKVETNNTICNNTPHSVAAGIIYFIAYTCNLEITKQDVKKVCDVSEVTINKCFQKMDAMKSQLIPECILAKYVTPFTPLRI